MYDYFGGCDHIHTHKVVWVGRPLDRATEAPCRILRYFRFHGEIMKCLGVTATPPAHDKSVMQDMVAVAVRCSQPNDRTTRHSHYNAGKLPPLPAIPVEVVWKLLQQITCGNSDCVTLELDPMYRSGILMSLLPSVLQVPSIVFHTEADSARCSSWAHQLTQ